MSLPRPQLSLDQAKQIALFVAVAGATVYKFLEELDQTKVKVIRAR